MFYYMIRYNLQIDTHMNVTLHLLSIEILKVKHNHIIQFGHSRHT
jgi:hypothetical protein